MKKNLDDLFNNLGSMTKEGLSDTLLSLKNILRDNSLLSESFEEEDLKNRKIKKLKTTNNLENIFSHIVMHNDLNPAETMYGGRMLELCDEAGCILLFKKYKVKKVVTTEMQNVYFLCSPKLGDVVTFSGEVLEERRASAWIRIQARNIAVEGEPVVIDCQMRFMFPEKIK